MSVTIGVDIGGTKIAGAVVSATGEILACARRDTPAQDPDQIAHDVAALVTDLRRGRDDVRAVGVACAGFVDRTGSTVLFAPNLAWRDEPMKMRLEALLDLPVIIENDANAAAWGEFRYGAATEADDMLLVTVGTGIGGGVVDRLAAAARGLRHRRRARPHARRARTASAAAAATVGAGRCTPPATRWFARRASWSPPERCSGVALSDACGGDPSRLMGHHVTTVAQAGDPAAAELLADLGRWLGEGAASMAAVLDPELIVIGGGVIAAGELLLGPARAAYGRQLSGRGHRPVAQIVPAALGNDAGMIGVAALAAEGVGR